MPHHTLPHIAPNRHCPAWGRQGRGSQSELCGPSEGEDFLCRQTQSVAGGEWQPRRRQEGEPLSGPLAAPPHIHQSKLLRSDWASRHHKLVLETVKLRLTELM